MLHRKAIMLLIFCTVAYFLVTQVSTSAKGTLFIFPMQEITETMNCTAISVPSRSSVDCALLCQGECESFIFRDSVCEICHLEFYRNIAISNQQGPRVNTNGTLRWRHRVIPPGIIMGDVY